MANALFDKGREGFLTASHGWLAGSVPGTWVPYIFGSFNVNLNTNTFLSDVPNTVWRARGTYLTTKGVAAGVASAANTLVAAVGSAGSATAVWIGLVNETNASNTSLLGAYIDTATGMPFLPNGGDVQINWDTGANMIFKL
jgi:hypothetical protein